MAFSSFEFTKSWENAQDFPTYEESEAQVRADLQFLHNELRDGLNRLIEQLNDPAGAGSLPIAPVEGLTATTVQEAIAQAVEQIQNAAAGQIVNGSITREKLSAALLRRIYGGRVVVAWDAPTQADCPDSDYPLGQLWLRPSLTVENAAGDFLVQGCTASQEADGLRFTASQAFASASQRLEGLGAAGQTALLHLSLGGRDASLTALTLYVNGVETDLPEGGFLSVTLDEGGALEVQIQAVWPSAEAAGYFTVADFTVVATAALEAAAPLVEKPKNWQALLAPLLGSLPAKLPQRLWIQTEAGVWHCVDEPVLPVSRGGTGLGEAAAGQLLCGGDGDALQALAAGDEGAVLQMVDGLPAWRAPDQAAQSLAWLRVQSGSYTGNAKARAVALPVAPKLLIVQGGGESAAVLLAGCTVSRQLMEADHLYASILELSGSSLKIYTAQGTYTPRAWNESGREYAYLALY